MFRDLSTLDLSTMAHSEIRDLVNTSEFGYLIPADFQVVCTEEILFIPTDAFWEKWKMARPRMEAEGCRVYGYVRRPRYGKNEDWRVQWQIKCLLIPDDSDIWCICGQEHNASIEIPFCQHCKTEIVIEG